MYCRASIVRYPALFSKIVFVAKTINIFYLIFALLLLSGATHIQYLSIIIEGRCDIW